MAQSTTLRSADLSVGIKPDRGGSIVSIVAASPGVELLYQPHWPAGAIEEAWQSPDAWVRAWRGGWNPLFPNAGSACSVRGQEHPFHGAASITPWTVTGQEADQLVLRWAGEDGLVLERTISVDSGVVRADTIVRNEGSERAAYIFVEHLIFGADVLAPPTRVEIAGATLVGLDGETGVPQLSGRWPRYGTRADSDDWSVRVPGASRFGALHDVVDRTARVSAPHANIDLQLSWAETFPYLWFWEERSSSAPSASDGPAVCLGLEPATAPTSEGLAAALERGEAAQLEPGDEDRYWVELQVRQ